ncbi:MAG: tRNA preQ1(34) S-adenosylmethionine ribosyltransferase-isomerase QueA [Microthrixaceae bacterium]
MRTAELDYELPRACIAQEPIEPRDAARLLVARGVSRHPGDGGPLARVASHSAESHSAESDSAESDSVDVSHRVVRELPELLDPGDLLVINTTKVLPSRVQISRSGGGSGEVLLLEDRGDGSWEALCRPSRKLPEGCAAESLAGNIRFEFGGDLGEGRRVVRPTVRARPGGFGHHDPELLRALERDGEMPLPPYIHARIADASRYQTTFAERPGSAAAPTAGLHLTAELLEAIRERGIGVAPVELVVGLDTFRPVSTEMLADHVIHTEHYRVPEQTWHDVGATHIAGGRVVAVGTTTTRALESVAHTGDLAGRTSLFITPGFDFRVVDRLLTNFHLPRSSLLAMIEAFVGPQWRGLYATAIDEGYRFLSFGDAMLLDRRVQR